MQRTGASIVLNLVLILMENMLDYLARWSGTAGPHQVLGKCINIGSAPFSYGLKCLSCKELFTCYAQSWPFDTISWKDK